MTPEQLSGSDLLRPMGAGDLLDQAIWLYRKNFLCFVLLIATLRVPFLIVVGLAQRRSADAPLALTPVNVVSLLVDNALLGSVLAAAITRAVADQVSGERISVWRAYQHSLAKIFRLLLNYVLAGGGYAVTLAFGTFCFGAASNLLTVPFVMYGAPAPLVGVLGIITSLLVIAIGCVPFWFLFARWSLTQQVIVLEGCGVLGAFGRSSTLIRGQYRHVMWFLAGLFLLGLLLSTGPSFVSQMVAEVVSPSYRGNSWWGVPYLLFQFAIPALIDLLFVPISFIARALLYYDLRVRVEGLDMQVRVARWAEGLA